MRQDLFIRACIFSKICNIELTPLMNDKLCFNDIIYFIFSLKMNKIEYNTSKKV